MIHHHVGKSGWKQKAKNILHHDQCKIQKRDKKSTEQYILACQYESELTASSTNYAAILQRIKGIQAADTSRNGGTTKI